MSRYSKALGLDSGHQVTTPLSVGGAVTWATSKLPAALGGHVADWVTEWAIKRWPKNVRGPKFVGGVATVVAAYGLAVGASKVWPDGGHMVDKLTDGMIGRVSPSLTSLLKSWMEGGKGAAAGPPANPGPANASLDGDRTAIMDVAGLLHASPETLSLMADQMFGIMQKDGVDIDAGGRDSVVTSMREAAGALAGGRF